MAVVITVPHGESPSGDGERNSDVGALEFLPILEESLEELEIPFTTLVGTVNRDILDLNRLRAYSHPWMQKTREALLDADVHICLHSYPPTEEPMRTSTGYDLLVWSEATVVIFNTPDITDQDLLAFVEEALEEMSIRTVEEQGGFENYISNMATVLMDVPSLLIEVNEGEAQNYRQAGSALAVGILNYLDSLSEPLPPDDELPLAEDE